MISPCSPFFFYRFDRARQKIAEKYDHVEQELIGEFLNAHRQGDKRKMKRIASVLQNFKGYGKCIETFIVECQKVNCFSSQVDNISMLSYQNLVSQFSCFWEKQEKKVLKILFSKKINIVACMDTLLAYIVSGVCK
jgi:hypothetical protein